MLRPCRGEGFVGVEGEAGHAFADAVALELLVDFGFERAGCGDAAGLCQEVLAFEDAACAVVDPCADEITFGYAAAAEKVADEIGKHRASVIECGEGVGGAGMSTVEGVAGGGEEQRRREDEGCKK